MSTRTNRPAYLMVQARPEWLAWLDSLGERAGAPSRTATVELALEAMARRLGHAAPPARARPVGSNRFGVPGK